jgi:putative ABC transport system substrate-binding protein
MGNARDAQFEAILNGLKSALAGLGWRDGQTIRFEDKWTEGTVEHVRAQAAALVKLKPDLIFTYSVRALSALKAETTEIPMVFVATSDPVGLGFAQSFARPGGNMSGFTLFDYSLIGKMLQTLRQIAPRVSQVGLMYAPANVSYTGYMRAFEEAAKRLGIEPFGLPVSDAAEISAAVARVAHFRRPGLLVPPDVTTQTFREHLVKSIAAQRIPVIYSNGGFAAIGGLISYGVDLADLFRRAASYIDRILRGESPGQLPIQQPTKVIVTINLAAAKAMGLQVPQELLVSADEVFN